MTQKQALIIDDEPDIRELLEITLGRMDIETMSAGDVTSAKALLADNSYDFCLTDMRLPDGNGLEIVEHIQQSYPHLPVAMMTAHGSMESAVQAMQAGAFDFVSKPVNLELLRNLVATALNLEQLATAPPQGKTPSKLLGKTTAMTDLRKQIAKLARSQAPVYIGGESGSGKELVARSIHEQGPHAGAPFIPVNCGAVPSELMESEFFGHTKGSFTGAVSDKQGLFQAANGGTLFLDEVADLPLAMQVKLLRAIQEKAIRPIGGQREHSVDVRILSATHKDLAAEVEAGTFRQDLYYRINVIELRVPSLRERTQDIQELARHLLRKIAADYDMEPPEISDEAFDKLSAYSFPGNVRELENLLERAFTLCEDGLIMPGDLGFPDEPRVPVKREMPVADMPEPEPELAADPEVPAVAQPKDGDSLETYLEDIEKNVIVEALEATRWNKTAAAKKLGISFRALRYRLKKLDLE